MVQMQMLEDRPPWQSPVTLSVERQDAPCQTWCLVSQLYVQACMCRRSTYVWISPLHSRDTQKCHGEQLRIFACLVLGPCACCCCCCCHWLQTADTFQGRLSGSKQHQLAGGSSSRRRSGNTGEMLLQGFQSRPPDIYLLHALASNLEEAACQPKLFVRSAGLCRI